MKMRPPCVPLITVDPYFSVWSPADKLTDTSTVHWTGKPNTMRGTVYIDGTAYRFMGSGSAPAMTQKSLNVTALITDYVFEAAGIELTASFMTPLFPDDLYYFTRPTACIAFFKRKAFFSSISVNGIRSSLVSNPINSNAFFTGIGFTSENNAWITSKYLS